MLSVTIGVVMALIIVAVIVMVVLRIQHTHVEEQNKSQMEDHAKQTKAVPIQRELRFREGCSLLADEKHPSSPFRKLDTSGDLSENDEKNPDIIPQQITGSYFYNSLINPEFDKVKNYIKQIFLNIIDSTKIENIYFCLFKYIFWKNA